ncbi:MAG TPA: lytic transglycosylase domain-containing protein [Jatrophihabitans sp.]|nr:lytic transglycosylase domain-containing protein [Jatrophihabitans sp.]
MLPPAVKAPGFAAFLRRHPKLGRRSAIGAIAGGVALFVVASITTPLAAANVASPPPPPADSRLPQLPVSTPSPAVAGKQVRPELKHVKKQAPVSHGVISGLAANGIPQIALNAYRVAAARMAHVAPGCGIDWALLAGIGREESDHGRFAGAVLHADGVSTPRIIGIPLNGSGTALIRDTDGASLDGDPVYDHAVGPMQFIPSTWAIYGTDANGDGKADVFNINDAALAAARYLCVAGGDLRTRAGQVRAILAYNHSDEYLAQVLALADAYRRGIPITGLPVGITSGPLPTITDTGYIPPANPGNPTAAHKTAVKTKATPKHKGRAATPTKSPSGSSTSTSGTKTSTAPSGTKSSKSPTPKPSSGSPSGSSPTPSPSTTCTVLDHLLGKC